MKVLGKIANIALGRGGYDEAMFGVSVTLSFSDGTACSDFKGGWSRHPGSRAAYTPEELEKTHADTYAWLRQLMTDAKVSEFSKLKGIPIEAEVEHLVLKSWRVLTEVL